MKKASITWLAGLAAMVLSSLAAATPIGAPEEQYWARWGQITDTDSFNDNAHFLLAFEYAGWHNQNAFGIYDINDPSNRLEIFSGRDRGLNLGGLSVTELSYDTSTGSATNETTGATINVGTTFGFYLENNQGLLFSDQDLNGGHDYVQMYDDNFSPFGFDLVLAWEDIPADYGNGGDWDYNDMIIGIYDVVGVPAPGTLAVFGLGLLGVVAFSRRRKAAV